MVLVWIAVHALENDLDISNHVPALLVPRIIQVIHGRSLARTMLLDASNFDRLSLRRYDTKENARTGSEPVHLTPERLLLTGIWRDAHEFARWLSQPNPALERIPQVFVDDQEVWAVVRVLEFADQKAAGDRRANVSLRHIHALDQRALGERICLLRHIWMVVDARAAKADDRRRKRMDLVVDAAQHLP